MKSEEINRKHPAAAFLIAMVLRLYQVQDVSRIRTISSNPS